MSEESLPVDDILSMRDKGYDNNKIIQELQTQGYDSSAIFDALNRADMEAMSADEDDMSMSFSDDASPSGNEPTDEELIEEVIQEKWNDLVDDLKQIATWKADVDSRMDELTGRIDSLQSQMGDVQDSLTKKLEDYDSTMKDVGTDVKAMEDVFSDVLPGFKETVTQLQNVVETLKKD